MLREYCLDFGLSPNDLRGKKVLDLGAGYRQFARECLEEGIYDVWSISESSRDWTTRLGSKRFKDPVNRWSTVGDMRGLPVATGSFDLVLARDSVTHVFEDPADIRRGLVEINRILKPDGRGLVVPGWMENWQDEDRERVREAILGLKVGVSEIRRVGMGMVVLGVMLVLNKK